MKRYITDYVKTDLSEKMVFITGPRQVGKTYLSKEIMKKYSDPVYLNNDDIDDGQTIRKREWPLKTDLLVLDEIHKMKDWKSWLKGTYDTQKQKHKFLITGSARLEIFRQSGESLAGRYFAYHLNPLSVKELNGRLKPYEAVEMLNKLGGFPEPFLKGSDDYAARWREQYFNGIIREDIMDLGKVAELRTMRTIVEMLRKRTGSPLSYRSLSEDVNISPNTVKKYIEILESLHIIFIIRPFNRNIARAITKEPKIYFYDSGYVIGDEGKRLENTAAVCLLKHIQFINDTKGRGMELKYIRNKDGKEVDFVLAENEKITEFIEVKLSKTAPDPSLKWFAGKHKNVKASQIVHNARNEKDVESIKVRKAGEWLAGLKA